MSVDHVFPSRRRYRCDICGHVDMWGPTWGYYGSLLLAETCPDDLPHACSEKCGKELEHRVKTGVFKLPVYKFRGYNAHFVSPKSGYGDPPGYPKIDEVLHQSVEGKTK